MPEALPELAWLGLLFLAFGVVYTLRKFIEGLFSPLIAVLGHIPGIGGALSDLLKSIEASISNKLGAAEAAIDRGIGASFHLFAKLTVDLWHQLVKHAGLLASIASFIPGLGSVVQALRSLVHHSIATSRSISGRVKHLEREYNGIEHRVRHLAHEVEHGIGHDVLPRIKSLDKEVGKIESQTIPALRDEVAAAENDVTALRKWIANNALVAGTAAFVGAVAWALGRLDLGALRCPSFGNLTNKRGCGLWNDLDALLGVAFIAAEIASLDELIGVAQRVTEDVTKGVEVLLDV